jgi:hypothetical protein
MTEQTTMTDAWRLDVTTFQDQSHWTPETAACLLMGLPVSYQPASDNPKKPPVFNEPVLPDTREEKQYWAILNGIHQAVDEGFLEEQDTAGDGVMVARTDLIRYAQQQFSDVLVEPFKQPEGAQSIKQAQAQKNRFVANRDSSWLRMLIVFSSDPQQYLHEKEPDKINMLQLHQDTELLSKSGRFPDKPALLGYDSLLNQYNSLREFSDEPSIGG